MAILRGHMTSAFGLIVSHLISPLGERLSGPYSVHLLLMVTCRPWATAMPLGPETWSLALSCSPGWDCGVSCGKG